MDVFWPCGTRRVPQELVDCICKYSSDDCSALLNARPICHAFNRGASALMSRPYQTPAELFTLPHGQDRYSDIQPEEMSASYHYGRWTALPLTIWVGLEIAPKVKLENRKTRIGRRFYHLCLAYPPSLLCTRCSNGGKDEKTYAGAD